MELKKCNGCGRELPYTNEFFNYRNKSKNILQSRCKECTRKATKISKEINEKTSFNIQVTAEQKRLIENNAKATGLTLSKYLKYAIIKNKPIIIRDLIELQPIENAFSGVEHQVKKLGNNANQIAKRLNEGGYIPNETILQLVSVMELIDKRISLIEYEISKAYKKYD